MNKIDYDLYQVKKGEEHLDYLFTSLSLLEKLKLKVDQNHYDRVYSGSVESNGSTGEVGKPVYEVQPGVPGRLPQSFHVRQRCGGTP